MPWNVGAELFGCVPPPAGDYLSDHFGLLCELRLAAGPVASPTLGRGAAAAARKRKLSPSAGRAAAAGHPPRQLFGGRHF